jgi:hypothetical protein
MLSETIEDMAKNKLKTGLESTMAAIKQALGG